MFLPIYIEKRLDIRIKYDLTMDARDCKAILSKLNQKESSLDLGK